MQEKFLCEEQRPSEQAPTQAATILKENLTTQVSSDRCVFSTQQAEGFLYFNIDLVCRFILKAKIPLIPLILDDDIL